MGVTGENVHFIAIQDGEHFVGVLDVAVLAGEDEADGAVLGHVDVRALGNVLQQAFHEVQGLLGVAFVVVVGRLAGVLVAAGLEDEAFHADDQVLAQPEGVVIRAESRFVGFAGSHTAAVLDVVVIADDCVEGDAGGGDGLFIIGKHLQLVPGYVAEGDAHGGVLRAVLLGHALQVSQRAAQEALEVFLILHLRVRHGENRVVGPIAEGLQGEIEGLGILQREVEGRCAGGEIGHIARRRNHVHKARVFVRVEAETSVACGSGKTIAVADNYTRKGSVSRLNGTFHFFRVQRERHECQADKNEKEFSHFVL